ncbi:hypothetical protein EVAR_58035_1 [Eumeta japonica]|uniref:Uncharacterized protein n=1 Tax=Eumeta variegata TaxID=151549 RepID=A0A4C1ZIJ3_EUMVA|nr:hypothetical protein EVAR_58035_1 [Eumeta japonica]
MGCSLLSYEKSGAFPDYALLMRADDGDSDDKWPFVMVSDMICTFSTVIVEGISLMSGAEYGEAQRAAAAAGGVGGRARQRPASARRAAAQHRHPAPERVLRHHPGPYLSADSTLV